MELTLFTLATAGYTAATALALGYAATRAQALTVWMWRILGAALVLHLASFGLRLADFWSAPDHRWFLPIHSFYGALSALALAVAGVFWAVEGRHRLNILGAFVLPLAWAAAAGALLRAWAVGGAEAGAVGPGLRGGWLSVHPLVLMAAYAGFANAFGVALALLIQERQVKSRKPSELCYRLPAIEELDTLNFRLIAVFLPVLTAGLLMGSLWAAQAWGRFWGWDAKEVFALVTWGLYAAFLYMRALSGMRGRKPMYVSMLAFASILFTFFAVDYLSVRHGYLSSGGNLP